MLRELVRIILILVNNVIVAAAVCVLLRVSMG